MQSHLKTLSDDSDIPSVTTDQMIESVDWILEHLDDPDFANMSNYKSALKILSENYKATLELVDILSDLVAEKELAQ